MIFRAVIRNKDHPEYGEVTIAFPIDTEGYDSDIARMEQLEIGNAVASDCYIESIDSSFPVLKCLNGRTANIDELDYLAKRLDSFDVGEAAQFQAMTHKLNLVEAKDLINLSFDCQMTTVITDFSDLNAVGRDHYMNLHGGGANKEELDNLDGEETALLLIDSGTGTITPYGVIYENGMMLKQHYTKGSPFPAYCYQQSTMVVEMNSNRKITRAENDADKTWLFLPMSEKQLEHAMLRAGLVSFGDMQLYFSESILPEAVDAAIDFAQDSILEINEMCWAVKKYSDEDMAKLNAVVEFAKPEHASQIKQLADNLELFEYIPGVRTPKEYGRYMIQTSGRFEYDPNLDEFYDYEKYAATRLNGQLGEFTLNGYIAYHGTMRIDELMMKDPAESYQEEKNGWQLGGLSQ